MSGDNRTLGRFHLEGLPPAPRGVPQVEVTFDIDADGILSVLARDKATGKEQKISITGQSGLSESEIDQMVDDAKKHEADDKKKKEDIELRNQAETMVYQTEKTLGEHKDKLEESDVSTLEAAIADCKAALEGEDADKIKSCTEALTQASHKLAEVMYQEATQDGGGPAAGAPSGEEGVDGGDDDVIDAEYEEA